MSSRESSKSRSTKIAEVKWSREGLVFVVGLTRCCWGWVQAPPGLQRNIHLPGLGELEKARLLGYDGALVLGGQLRNQLCLQPAGFLGVQVTLLLRNVNKRGDGLVMALLRTFLKNTASSADLDRKLLTAGVPNELARLLLHVLGRARGLVHRLANFFTLPVANLLCWLVTLPHCLVEGLLLEGDGAGLLEVLFTHLLLGRSKLGDISIVALLGVLVGAL